MARIACAKCGGSGVDEKATAERLQEDIAAVREAAAKDGKKDVALWARERWLRETLSGNAAVASALFDVIAYFQDLK